MGKRTHRPHRAEASAHPGGKPVAARETHWGEVAEWYDKLVGDEGSEYHREVIIPGVFRMLGLEAEKGKGKRLSVLDLACGQGVLCRRLAEAGCTVTGIDGAAPLIEAARRRDEGLAIRYAVGDATKLVDESGVWAAGLAAGSFDAVTIVLAIQNITPLSPVWQACAKLLKPGGSLVVVMMHPCFRVPKQSDWVWEEHVGEGGAQGRVVRQYLTSSKVEIQTHPGLAAHGKSAAATTHFHRPLQAYVNTLGNAGLLIDHIEEWISHKVSQAGPRKLALDRARKEIPMFLAIRARTGYNPS
jgi:SAM-dependent methyltransferase